MSSGQGIERRKLLVTALAATAVGASPALAQIARTAARAATQSGSNGAPGPGHKFFSSHEFATLDELAEMIIPADEVSGGARAAEVASYVDGRVAELVDPQLRQGWRDDLAEIDRLAEELFGRKFVKSSFEQRTRLMQHISKNEKSPKEAGEYAFGSIKWAVADAYYRSRIGIHDDMKYKGNVLQAEFAGTDVSSR